MKKIVLFIFSLFIISCSDHDDSPPPVTLTKVEIFVDRDVLPVGVTTQGQVLGYYTDGTTSYVNIDNIDSLDSSGNITLSPRDSFSFFITATAVGEATIAVSESGLSDTFTMTVSDAELVSIDVTPKQVDLIEGLTQTYTAIGTYSDTTTHTIDNALWESSDSTVATIDASTGIATGLIQGNTYISATVGELSGSTNLRVVYKDLLSIEVTAATEQLTLPVGVTQTFYARAFYDNGTDEDVTENENFQWHSSDKSVLNNDHDNGDGFNHPYNVYTALEIGVAEVTVTSISHQATVTSNIIEVNVEHKTYQGIKVTTESNSIPVGITKRFTATAYFGENSEDQYDVSLLSNWSSNSDAASVVLGFVHGNTVTTGTTDPVEITATFAEHSDFETVWITDAIVQSIDVTPDNIIISRGYSQQYTARGHFSDGSSHDLSAEEGVAWSVPVAGDLDGDGLWDTSDQNASITLDGLVTNTHADFNESTADYVTANLSGISGNEKVYLPAIILLRHQNLEFAGTPSIGEVIATGTPYDAENTYAGDVVLNFSQAQAYCDALIYNHFANWRLPTVTELQAFDDEYNPRGTDTLSSVYNWPLISGYWTSTPAGDDAHHVLGLLNLGGNTEFPDDYAGNVSCVREYQ